MTIFDDDRSVYYDFEEFSDREWFAVGCLFYPYDTATGAFACQSLAMMDYQTQCNLGEKEAGREPGTYTAEEVISFISERINRHGKPTVGLHISPTIWAAYDVLSKDPEYYRVIDIAHLNVTPWPAMLPDQRNRIRDYIRSLGLYVSWTTMTRYDGRESFVVDG